MQTKSTKDSIGKLELLNKKKQIAEEGGGLARIEKQKKQGKMTAQERVNFFLDAGTFEEFDKFVVHRSKDFGMEERKYPGDGVITGHGLVDGREVFVFAQDFTVFGGSLSETHAKKICKIMDMAMKTGCPVIGLNDSGGARIQEGVVSLGGYADIFLRNTLASGVIPQISCIMGPCAGGAVYSPAITDFNIMVKDTSYMFITGPDVIKTVTHEDVTKDELGGAMTHNAKSGVAHFAAEDDEHCLRLTRELLSFVPSNNMENAPFVPSNDSNDRTDEKLNSIVPESSNQPYDIREIINNVVDENYFFEIHEHFAQNIVIGFARLGGHSVGIVANQPSFLAGVLDIDASIKAAKDWRTDKYLRNLEALMIVADKDDSFLISGNGDVIASDEGLLSIGSGSMYALAAARALLNNTDLSAKEIARKALEIAGEICIYTNSEIILEEI
jgi:propionyl-CoA carboxylase beta chain